MRYALAALLLFEGCSVIRINEPDRKRPCVREEYVQVKIVCEESGETRKLLGIIPRPY